jgi:hypothetical protein
MPCLNKLCELEWIAIGSIGTFLLAIAAFITLAIQGRQFKKLRIDENERQFKTSSITLITKFDKDFQKLGVYRFDIGNIVIDNKVIETNKLDFSLLETQAGEMFDFLDTLGYSVREKYIKTDVVHQYFHYWFHITLCAIIYSYQGIIWLWRNSME